jgi:hypothetical protein
MSLKAEKEHIDSLILKNMTGRKRNLILTEESNQQLNWLYYECKKNNNPKSYGQLVSAAIGMLYKDYTQ